MVEFDLEGQESENVLVHLIAGGAGGIAEHCAMFPIDTIKTHIQSAAHAKQSISIAKMAKDIIKDHGILGLFRGLTAMASAAGPAHALHFATYEQCKKLFGGSTPGHHPIASGLAGICATAVSDAVLTPMDAVKQRMQLGARVYRGLWDCIRTVSRSEGFRALYAGYTTTLTMNMPYFVVYFAGYESLKKTLGPMLNRKQRTDPVVHILAGGGAGVLAGAVTNPFDVAKTRLQTQGDVGKVYGGMVHALKTIWKEEGLRGYTRGIRPRMTLHSMSAAICWTTYEYFKRLLGG